MLCLIGGRRYTILTIEKILTVTENKQLCLNVYSPTFREGFTEDSTNQTLPIVLIRLIITKTLISSDRKE